MPSQALCLRSSYAFAGRMLCRKYTSTGALHSQHLCLSKHSAFVAAMRPQDLDNCEKDAFAGIALRQAFCNQHAVCVRRNHAFAGAMSLQALPSQGACLRRGVAFANAINSQGSHLRKTYQHRKNCAAAGDTHSHEVCLRKNHVWQEFCTRNIVNFRRRYAFAGSLPLQ